MVISYHIISQYIILYHIICSSLHRTLLSSSSYLLLLTLSCMITIVFFFHITSIYLLLRIQFCYCRPASLNTLKEQKKSGEGFKDGKMNFSTYQLVRTVAYLCDYTSFVCYLIPLFLLHWNNMREMALT